MLSKAASQAFDPSKSAVSMQNEFKNSYQATAMRKKTHLVQLGRHFDQQSRASIGSKDHPTIEQSNPRLIDDTFNQLGKKENALAQKNDTVNDEDMQESCCISISQQGANQRAMQHNKPPMTEEEGDYENVPATVGNDVS